MAILCTGPLAEADEFAYVATSNGTAGILGTVDLNTGAFTQIQSPQPQPYMGGLAELNGVLYATGNPSGSNTILYQVSPSGGVLTAIGPTGVSLDWFGSTTTGLFALSAASNNASLYSINPSTGAATLIGPTGISTVYSDAGTTTGGASAGGQSLYVMVSTGNTLTSKFYSINTATGAATLIATLSDGVCMKNMAFVNGTLYAASGYCTAGSNIYAINPSTGFATQIASAAGYSDLEGLAAPIISPQPAIVSLTPNFGAGTTVTFSAVYSDPNGVADLKEVFLLVSGGISGDNACYVYYKPEVNLLYLATNSGDWIKPPLTPGVAGADSNRQCTLNAGLSWVSTTGNDLTLNVALSFSSTFTGSRNVYLYAADGVSGLNSGWVQGGTWAPN
jgi:hypothetical protein